MGHAMSTTFICPEHQFLSSLLQPLTAQYLLPLLVRPHLLQPDPRPRPRPRPEPPWSETRISFNSIILVLTYVLTDADAALVCLPPAPLLQQGAVGQAHSCLLTRLRTSAKGVPKPSRLEEDGAAEAKAMATARKEQTRSILFIFVFFCMLRCVL